MKRIFYILILSFFVLSCQRQEVFEDNSILKNEQNISIPQEDKLILGKKLANPYALKTMQQAFEAIGESSQRGAFESQAFYKKLQATHWYVVFLPENQEHLQILNEMISSKKYVTRHHPMDYEIKQYGSYYVDSRTKDEKFPVLYASIPVRDMMPNVPFEKLEDLYLTDERNDPQGILEASSLYLTDHQNEITTHLKEPNAEALIVEGLKKELEVQAFFGFGRKWHPDGFIRVQSSEGGAYEPLRNAEIEIYNWFFNAYCYTDNNGYFRSSERFSREMGVYSTWDGNCKISTHWNEILGVRRSDKLGNIGRPTKDFWIDYKNKHHWKKAITHNALQRFNDYARSQGMLTLPKIHIWTFEGIHRGQLQ